MALTLYDASIPSFLNMMRNLAAILRKAEAHAMAGGVDPTSYLEAQLAPDMRPLVRQIQMASDSVKGGAGRLANVTPPEMPDTEATWADVQARVAKTIAFLESIDRAAIDGGDDQRIIELKMPGRTLPLTAPNFLLRFSLPNAYFHVVTAYALLRAQGVPLAKSDYLMGDQGLPS